MAQREYGCRRFLKIIFLIMAFYYAKDGIVSYLSSILIQLFYGGQLFRNSGILEFGW